MSLIKARSLGYPKLKVAKVKAKKVKARKLSIPTVGKHSPKTALGKGKSSKSKSKRK